jgi:hypothetical protein
MDKLANNRIGINFCGGCNPRIERLHISEAVRKSLVASGSQVRYNDWDADIIIYMSGCTANCIRQYSGNQKPCVVVAGETVDGLAVDANELVDQIAARVRERLDDPTR